MKLLITTAILAGSLFAQRKQGSPLEHLPKNMEVITHFGERADFSPDNQRIAFMSKSFGDALVIDLKTRIIRCLTCGIPGAAFLRIMHLADGNYILIGPERFSDIATSRRRDNELWFLSKEPESKPIKLGQKMSEGAAVSKKSLRMAWSETDAQFPELPRDYSRLVVAEIVPSGAGAKLINKKTVYESKDASCRIEAQDFYDNDTKMTFTCYRPKGLAGVMGIDLNTGKVRDFLRRLTFTTKSRASSPTVSSRLSNHRNRSRRSAESTGPGKSTFGSCASTERERTSPASPPSTIIRAGKHRTQWSRPTGAWRRSRSRAHATKPESVMESSCCGFDSRAAAVSSDGCRCRLNG